MTDFTATSTPAISSLNAIQKASAVDAIKSAASLLVLGLVIIAMSLAPAGYAAYMIA